MYSNKQYIIRVYDKDENYLGVWNDRISELSWTHQINSSGPIFDVELARTTNYGEGTDCAVSNRVEISVVYGETTYWTTHDETDEIIDMAVINNESDIIFSDGAPNGRVVFNGVITRVIPQFGSDTVTATIASRGLELDKIIIEESNYAINNTTSVGSWNFGNQGAMFNTYQVAQVFQSDVTDRLTSIIIVPTGGDTVSQWPIVLTIELYQGDDPSADAIPANLLGTGTISGSSSLNLATAGLAGCQLDTPVDLVTGEDYFFIVTVNVENTFPGSDKYPARMITNSAYANGDMWYSYNDGVDIVWATATGTDMAFAIKTSSGDTTVNYSYTELAEILKDLLEINTNFGGSITYSDALNTIQETSVVSTVQFKTNTVLEGIQKILELAPSGFYWYVDLGTNLLYFKEIADEPEIIITKGKEIQTLAIEETLEAVVNVVYFSGGDTGSGTNLFVKRVNTDSINQWGRFSERVSDNRVTQESSAILIADSILERGANPRYKTQLVLSADKIDIENINLGQVIGFRNFDNYIDDLALQIVSITYHPDYLTISLDSLLPKVSRTVDTLRRQLKQQETENNPSSPS